MWGHPAVGSHIRSLHTIPQGRSFHKVGDVESVTQIDVASAGLVGNPFVVPPSCGLQLDVQWSYIGGPHTSIGVGCFA